MTARGADGGGKDADVIILESQAAVGGNFCHADGRHERGGYSRAG